MTSHITPGPSSESEESDDDDELLSDAFLDFWMNSIGEKLHEKSLLANFLHSPYLFLLLLILLRLFVFLGLFLLFARAMATLRSNRCIIILFDPCCRNLGSFRTCIKQ